MKKCYACKKAKPVAGFHKDNNRADGLSYECKACVSVRKKHYHQHRGGKEVARIYDQTPARKASKARHARLYRQKNQDKIKAHTAINNAVLAGELPLVSTMSCLWCGEQAQCRHHYLGYEEKYWLDVLELCTECHVQAHSRGLEPERRRHG